MEADTDHVTLTVAKTDDLRSVAPAYAKLVASGQPATLEVNVQAGSYTGVALQLQDAGRRGQVSVTIRGPDDGVAVLDDVPLAIDGERVELDRLVIKGNRAGRAASFAIRSSLVLDRVAFVGTAGRKEIAGPVVQITAAYRTGAKDVTLRDSWFVGNGAASRLLLGLVSSLPDEFGAVRIDHVVFAGDAVTMDPGNAERLDLQDVLAVGGEPIVRVSNARTKVTLDGCYLGGASERQVQFTQGERPIERYATRSREGEPPDGALAEAERRALALETPDPGSLAKTFGF